MIPWALVQDFAAKLGWAWDRAGRPQLEVSSWYRTAERNRAVGGHPRSQHLLALAVDVVGTPASLHAFQHAADDATLHPIMDERHLHVQLFIAGAVDHLLQA